MPVVHHPGRPRLRLLTVLVSLGLLIGLGAAPATANVRIENTPVPFYARIVGPAFTGAGLEVFRTDEWAAIPFYRPPECVPSDFNLLEFFDPAAFGCNPMTVKQDTVWKNGPETDSGPIHARSLGLGAVPIWFIGWPELEAAVADGELTIGELSLLPSLMVGGATYYSETLNPSPPAKVGRAVVVARGWLEDGRSFYFQGVESDTVIVHARIAFR